MTYYRANDWADPDRCYDTIDQFLDDCERINGKRPVLDEDLDGWYDQYDQLALTIHGEPEETYYAIHSVC